MEGIVFIFIIYIAIKGFNTLAKSMIEADYEAKKTIKNGQGYQPIGDSDKKPIPPGAE